MARVRWHAALAVVATGLGLAASSAAGRAATLYVGHGAVGDDSSCSSPGYRSVQAAVDAAAANDRVYLCGAQFSEQVFVSRSITLTGDRGSGLTATGTRFTSSTARYPSRFRLDRLLVPRALLVVTGPKTDARVNGLTISGPIASPDGCAEQEFGVLALAGTVRLKDDSVLDINEGKPALYACQTGVAIQVGRDSWPTADLGGFVVQGFSSKADIDHTTVSGYQKNGITVDGRGSNAAIHGSTVSGGGPGMPFGASIAQNGIQISRGAGADVRGNTVSGNAYSGAAGASSGGVLVFGGCGDPLTAGVHIRDNTLVDNDVGVWLDNETRACIGVASSTQTKEDVAHNAISKSAVTNTSGFDHSHGYQAGIADIGNEDVIHDNTISGGGYEPETSPAFVFQIDTTAAIEPRLQRNRLG